MMAPEQNNKFFYLSLTLHIVILLVLVLGLDISSPLPVLENTNKNDVISAVVLGDTEKSKILPQQLPPPKPIVKEEPKPKEVKAAAPKEPPAKPLPPKEDAIAIKAAEKKKLAEKKLIDDKKRQEKLMKDLLADIEQTNEKQKKVKEKATTSQFQKTLREQAEKSLRQQLLNEEIKLQGTQSRQAQGEVNKYKALILQAISENWVVPLQANKKLYCELRIRIAPGGMVLNVDVTKTSGDPSLDSSARAAVLKSSPLPVPSDPAAFESFREFVLKVKPENIMPSGIG